jgi:hypothetical protein
MSRIALGFTEACCHYSVDSVVTTLSVSTTWLSQSAAVSRYDSNSSLETGGSIYEPSLVRRAIRLGPTKMSF